MELARNFEIASSCRSVTLGSIEPDQQYPVVHAERINTRYDQSVLLAILDSPATTVKLFLPKRDGDVSDEVLEVVNCKRVVLYLIYKGKCPKTNSYILELKRQ
jgi:hypothetical protein